MLRDLARRAFARGLKKAVPESLAADAKRIVEDIETRDARHLLPDSRTLLKKYSKARLLLPLSAVDSSKLRDRGVHAAPRATSIAIHDYAERAYVYFNDGSLRNLNSRKRVLAERKLARKARAHVIAAARRHEATARV